MRVVKLTLVALHPDMHTAPVHASHALLCAVVDAGMSALHEATSAADNDNTTGAAGTADRSTSESTRVASTPSQVMGTPFRDQ
jgi:hypothetical protein